MKPQTDLRKFLGRKDHSLPRQSEVNIEDDYKKSRISYTRDFLFSLALLDKCKKLPELIELILREFDGIRDGSSTNRCDSDIGSCYNLQNRSWQISHHDGLLGRAAFPRAAVCVAQNSTPTAEENGYILHRSKEPYRPPCHLIKVASNSQENSYDICHDETFGSSEPPNKECSEEKRRRAIFELMRKEQQKVKREMPNRHSNEHKSKSNLDFVTAVKGSTNDKKLASKWKNLKERVAFSASSGSSTYSSAPRTSTFIHASLISSKSESIKNVERKFMPISHFDISPDHSKSLAIHSPMMANHCLEDVAGGKLSPSTIDELVNHKSTISLKFSEQRKTKQNQLLSNACMRKTISDFDKANVTDLCLDEDSLITFDDYFLPDEDSLITFDDYFLPDEDSLITVDDSVSTQNGSSIKDDSSSNSLIDYTGKLADLHISKPETCTPLNLRNLTQPKQQPLYHRPVQWSSQMEQVNSQMYLQNQAHHHMSTYVLPENFQHYHTNPDMLSPGNAPPGLPRGLTAYLPNQVVCYVPDFTLNYQQPCHGYLRRPYSGGVHGNYYQGLGGKQPTFYLS